MIAIFVAVFVICILLKIKRSKQPWENGPWGLPFVGNLLQLTHNPPLQFSKWAAQYGSLYTLRFGTQPALVINDGLLIKQIFSKQAATGRPYSALFEELYHFGGIVNSSGRVWQEQRNFLVKSLKQFASRQQLEFIVSEEVDKFCVLCEREMEQSGKVYIGSLLKALLSNIMWAVITGNRRETNIANLMEDWIESLQKITRRGVTFFPWIGLLAPRLSGYSEFKIRTAKLREFVKDQIRNERGKNMASDNIITAYLQHGSFMTNEDSSFYGEPGRRHSFESILALMLAGTETTSTTINWLIFHLLTDKSIQAKLAEELNSEEDAKNRPYLEAVIEETLRFTPALPFGIIQQLEEPIELNGQTFPKGLHLLPNIYHANHDEKVWGRDAHVFRPERFLESKSVGSSVGYKKGFKENVASFQPGRRVCPGEQLGRDVIELIVSQLIATFEFLPVEGISPETYRQPDFSYITQARNFPVIMRKKSDSDAK